MKQKGIRILLCMLLVVMMIPAAAFAAEGHTVNGKLDLTGGTDVGTLETDGYAWDAAKHVLTMKDLTVTGWIQLPDADCQINVKGICSIKSIELDSDAGSAVEINGETGASLNGRVAVSGDLTLTNLTMTDGELYNGSVGLDKVLKLNNSNITLHFLSWMTDGGIDLNSSDLKVERQIDVLGQFRAEKIAMDEASRIESDIHMSNYGHFTPEQQGVSDDYIAEPAGGRFDKAAPWEGAADTYLTIVDKEGKMADHFILEAPEPPKEQCEITLKASPAEGGTVSGDGRYDMGTEAIITAEANKGYHFVQWQDYEGKSVSKDATYQFVVKETAEYTAVFEKGEAETPSQPGGTDQKGQGDQNGSASVKTGDDSHAGLWIALLAASAMGLAGAAIVRRRSA